jgi:cob(I)alamin adenosyltransferase
MNDAALDARHAEKVQKRQAARARIQATKTIEKGLLIVNTGRGKYREGVKAQKRIEF